MLHQVRTLDPRDPPLPTTPEYLRFRQALSATEHVRVLADMLRNTAKLYDGDLAEPTTVIEPRYLRAAELAVRWCSEEARASAERMAEAHAISRFETLLSDLRGPEATEDRRGEIVAQFVHDCIRVRDFHLTHACGRHALEQTEFERLEAQIHDGD